MIRIVYLRMPDLDKKTKKPRLTILQRYNAENQSDLSASYLLSVRFDMDIEETLRRHRYYLRGVAELEVQDWHSRNARVKLKAEDPHAFVAGHLLGTYNGIKVYALVCNEECYTKCRTNTHVTSVDYTFNTITKTLDNCEDKEFWTTFLKDAIKTLSKKLHGKTI